MASRRSFLKGLASLPLVGAIKPVLAAEPEPESNVKILCPHCFEMAGREHMCEGYAKWLLEHNDA